MFRFLPYNARVGLTVLAIASYVVFNYFMIDDEVDMFIDYWLVLVGLRRQRRYFKGERQATANKLCLLLIVWFVNYLLLIVYC